MSPTFEDHSSPKGIYTRIASAFTPENKDLLANVTASKELYTFPSNPWGKELDNKTTRFKRCDNNREFTTNLFGETLGGADGTALGAFGGSNIAPGQVSLSLFTRFNVTSLT